MSQPAFALALVTTLAGPAARGASSSSDEWKRSLRSSGLVHASAVTGVTSGYAPSAPHSVAAWKIAETQSGYAKAVLSTIEPAATALRVARWQESWSLHPTRFDAAHPLLGALFTEQQLLNKGVPASSLNGLLPNTPAFNYYRWRRSLDPARFDANHPFLGPLLAVDQDVRNRANPPAQEVITPPPSGTGTGTTPGTPAGGTTAGNPPAGETTTPVVPEPSTLALLLIGTGLLLAPGVRKKLLGRGL